MKYDSTYFNKERYYDPTAGAAILNIIREEKQHRYTIPAKKPDELELFSREFCNRYGATHPPRANGKPLRYTRPSIIKKQIKLYEYCMAHCDDTNFSIENVALQFGFGSSKKVEQCFSGRGNIGKLTRCWNDYKATGAFNWNQGGEK